MPGGKVVATKVSICIKQPQLAALVMLGVLAFAAAPAAAGLGGELSAVDADAVAMRGTMSSAAPAEATSSYAVRSLVSGEGTVVHEYGAPSGPVFGVAWQGRRPPDLSVLLGSYYSEYASAAAQQRHPNLHHEVIHGPNSVIVMGGRMGRVVGRAYVPGLAPAGVDAKAVVK